MASIFTKIINGEIPCYKIAENEHFFAFLDINPNAWGHTLCVPKKEVDKLLAIEKVVPCDRVGVAVVGLEVPHAHVHLIPINSMSDMDFKNNKARSQEEFTALASEIATKL